MLDHRLLNGLRTTGPRSLLRLKPPLLTIFRGGFICCLQIGTVLQVRMGHDTSSLRGSRSIWGRELARKAGDGREPIINSRPPVDRIHSKVVPNLADGLSAPAHRLPCGLIPSPKLTGCHAGYDTSDIFLLQNSYKRVLFAGSIIVQESPPIIFSRHDSSPQTVENE